MKDKEERSSASTMERVAAKDNLNDIADHNVTDVVELLQVKTVLMGEVGAGKTSLLNALRFGESRLAPSGPEGRTINIEVHSVDLSSNQRLWVYDFGGHETYHFSQQLFLSKESIYVIIVDIAQYQPIDFDKKIRHWYNMVTSRVVAPIICVLASHIDECENQNEAQSKYKDIEEKLRELEFDQLNDIRKQMDHIKNLISEREGKDSIHVFQAKSLEKPRARLERHLNNRPKIYRTVNKVSALTLEGVATLKQFMSKVIQENNSSFQKPHVPKGWVELGLTISSQRTERPWMSFHEFAAMTKDHGVRGKKDTIEVLRYLQSLGIVLYYNDHRTKSVLDSYVFSSANLLLAIFGLVYNHNYHQDEIKYIWKDSAILRMQQSDFLKLIGSLKHKGLIGEKLLQTFWECLGVKGEVFQSVLSLLDKFDLCYEIPVSRSAYINQDRYFVFPYLLSSRIPTEALVVWPQDNPDEQKEFGMQLDIFSNELPLGLFEKILVRSNEFLDYSISWKQGMVAFCNGGIDLVRLEVTTNEIQPRNYWTLDNSTRRPWNKHKIETANLKPKSDHVILELSTRVQQGREDKAGHVVMLLVAVINRIILHHYPGTVALWYVLCPSCVKIRSQDQTTSPAKFPADNVILPKNKDQVIKCYQCYRDNMKLGHIFPQSSDMAASSNEANDMRSYLQSHADHVTRHLAVRPVVRHLLKKGIITVSKAQDIIAMETEERKQEATFRMLVSLDRKQMEDLCYYLDRNNETETANILAVSLYPRQDTIKQLLPRNINNNAIDKKDSPESKSEQQHHHPPATHSSSPNSSSVVPPKEPAIVQAVSRSDTFTTPPKKEQIKKAEEIISQKSTDPMDLKSEVPQNKPKATPLSHQERPSSTTGKNPKIAVKLKESQLDSLDANMVAQEHAAKVVDKEDAQSIQDLTLTDDLAKHVDMASPPEKVRWKDGRYVGTDYVKLHIQKFFTRKVVHTRKEGDIDVQETKIQETEVREERMKGADTKEITVRKETTEEKWEELKTKTLESGKPQQAMKPITSAVSMLEIRKQESPKKDPPKAVSLENVAAKDKFSGREKSFKIVTQSVTKRITPQILEHVKTTKSEQQKRKSMPDPVTQSPTKKILSKPRPLRSYTSGEQYKDPMLRSNDAIIAINEPARQEQVHKSVSMEKLRTPQDHNKVNTEVEVKLKKISAKPREKPEEYVEIIESSVKCFQSKIGNGVSKESLPQESKPKTNIKVDDVLLNNKENKNTLNYRTQYKSGSPPRELPTIIKRDQTYKLRDQYSLGNKVQEKPKNGEEIDIEKRLRGDQTWNEPIMNRVESGPTIRNESWTKRERERDSLPFETENSVPYTNVRNTKDQYGDKPSHRDDVDRRGVDERYEEETRRVLAEMQNHSYEVPYYEETYNQRQFPSDLDYPTREEDQDRYQVMREEPQLPEEHMSWKQPLKSSYEDLKGVSQPTLKKYVSEKSLPLWSVGLYNKAPPSGQWSTVSLPDVKNVEESHKSNLNKWKETNLDTSSESSDGADARRYPTKTSHSLAKNDKIDDGSPEDDRRYLHDYARSYPEDDEDPKYFVKSVMDQARNAKYGNSNDNWIETDLDAPVTAAYDSYDTGFDHIYENDNSGWWVETDLDIHEDFSRNDSFNRTFVSDADRQDKYWKSLGPEQNRAYNAEEYDRYEDQRDREGYGVNVDDIYRDNHRGNLYENLDPHIRYPGQYDRYLDILQGLYQRHDDYSHREPHHNAGGEHTDKEYEDQGRPELNREHKHRNDIKHVHYEDEPQLNSSEFDRNPWNTVSSYEKSPTKRKEKHYRDEQIPTTIQKYNTMPNMKKNKKEQRSDEPGAYRYSDHGEPYSSDRYNQDLWGNYDPYTTQQKQPYSGSVVDKHNRSFEISPDMYYTHSFGSSDTNWQPRPEISQGYNSARSEPYPYHTGEPEYWERIPIEGQQSPRYQREPVENVPRQHQADPIPGWNSDPVQDHVVDREAAERVSSHNNSDLGFHELSFASLPSSEPPQEYPKIRPNQRDTNVMIEGMRFKQLEVHRTTAAALNAASKVPKEHGVPRIKEDSVSRKRSRDENAIYENLRPVEKYWPDTSMDRARKGEVDMTVYGHEHGWGSGSEFARDQNNQLIYQRHVKDRSYSQPLEAEGTKQRPSGAHSKKASKERSMSYRYRPQSEHLEQHRDMIQGYLDEINSNIPASGSKHKSSKHKRHSQGPINVPSTHEQVYERNGTVSDTKRSSSHKKHKHSQKESSKSDQRYMDRDRYQSHTLPRSLRFQDEGMRSYYELSEPHTSISDNKGFVVTGKPKKTKNKDKDINAYFLSQV